MKPVTFDEIDSAYSETREPWSSDKWRIVSFPDLGGATLDPLACLEMDLPMPSFNDCVKHYGVSSMSFVGGIQIDGFNMTLNVDDNWRAMKYIWHWFRTMQNPDTGGFHLPSFYMKDFDVALFSKSTGDVIVKSKILNCWPQNVGQPQLNRTSEALEAQVQFKCFRQKLTFLK
mgnify:CR=1 FL=1